MSYKKSGKTEAVRCTINFIGTYEKTDVEGDYQISLQIENIPTAIPLPVKTVSVGAKMETCIEGEYRLTGFRNGHYFGVERCISGKWLRKQQKRRLQIFQNPSRLFLSNMVKKTPRNCPIQYRNAS
ncbi:MAG: hypothetical protein QMD85_00275 [Candidatus Aenigmarchaeota archaeon]|nr:hypothetical protein [Candidatus Aenigmarchaeota archaeon]